MFDFFRMKSVGSGFVFPGVSQGHQGKGFNVGRKIQQGGKGGFSSFPGMQSHPAGPQSQGMGCQQQVLGGRTAIDYPVTIIMLKLLIPTDNDAVGSGFQHPGMGVNFHNFIQQLRLVDHYKMPWLTVHRRRGIHGSGEYLFNGFMINFLICERADTPPVQ